MNACPPCGLSSSPSCLCSVHRDESQSTAFSAGDWAIAVECFERGSDRGRLTFAPGDGVVCFVNSTELRHIVAEGGVFQGEFTLERKEEADAQDWCR